MQDLTSLFSSLYGIFSAIIIFTSAYESLKLSGRKSKIYLLYAYIFSFILLFCSHTFILMKFFNYPVTKPLGLVLIVTYFIYFSHLLRSYEFVYSDGVPRIYIKINSWKLWRTFGILFFPSSFVLFFLLFSTRLIDLPTTIVLSLKVILFWVLFIHILGNKQRLTGVMTNLPRRHHFHTSK